MAAAAAAAMNTVLAIMTRVNGPGWRGVRRPDDKWAEGRSSRKGKVVGVILVMSEGAAHEWRGGGGSVET